jgi:hypothetical protein
MAKPKKKKHLKDSYKFPEFYPGATVSGVFGDQTARVLRLSRRSKKRYAVHAKSSTAAGTTAGRDESETFPAGRRACTWKSTYAESTAADAMA